MLFLSILFFLLLTILNLRLAAFILIVLLPSYLLRFNIGPVPSTFLEAMFFCLTFVWLIQNIKSKNLKNSWQNLKNIIKKPFLIIIAIFILSATIAIFISPNTRAALGVWKAYFIEPLVLFYLFLNIFSKKDIHQIIFSLSLSAFLISALAIIQKFTGLGVPYTFWGKDNTFRVTSFFGYPNAIGLYLAPIIPLIFFYTTQLAKEFKKKIITLLLYCFIIILSLLAIIFANSTGALMALISGLLITALFNKKTFWPAIILIFLGILLLIFNVLPANTTNALLLKDWSGQVRIKMWTETISMLKDNWFFGAGLSGYPNVVAPYHLWSFVEIFQYPHNLILNFWSELGLLGLLSFLSISFVYLKNIIQQIKKTNDLFFYALLFSFLIILIHGLVDVPYFKNDLAIIFWLIISMSYLYSHKNK